MVRVRSVVLSFFVTSICVPSSVLAAPPVSGLRLASPQEGEAIVQAAWELRHGLVPKPDCSHFVHAVYTQAGFLYDYAASRAIFAGIEGFRRVKKPQAGDVIVWQGHIGIVIDPRQHSFYSSVTAGFAIQSYQSRYWTGRGTPRFYRFLVYDEPSPASLLTNIRLRGSPPGQVLSSLTQYFTARPPILMQSAAPQMAAWSKRWEGAAQQSAQIRSLQMEERSIRPIIDDRPVQIQASAAATNNARVKDQVLVTAHTKPGKKEVLLALRRSVDANGQRLMRSRSLDSQPSVSVVDGFKIVAMNLQGNSGVADVEVKEKGAFEHGRAIPRRTTERRHVTLRRQEQGWVLVMPEDLTCLNRDLAILALTDHLANVQGTPANIREATDSRRLLNDLTERKLWNPSTWFRAAKSSDKVPSATQAGAERSAAMPRGAESY